VTQKPNSSLGGLLAEVRRSHTDTHIRVPLNERSACRRGP